MKNLSDIKKISWVICGLAFGVILSYLLILYMKWVEIAGFDIPQDDLIGDYFVGVLWASVLGMSILLWPVSKQDKTGLMWAWLAKIIVTLGFLLIYEYTYNDDQWSYFSIPRSPNYHYFEYSLGWPIRGGDNESAYQPVGTRNIDHFVIWHNLIFPSDSYHAVKISFSMVGLIAIYLFYRAGMLFMEKKGNLPFFYVLALIPTDLVWSSTLGKEPIVLLGIGLYVYGVVAWRKKGQIFPLIISLAGVILAGSIRNWLYPILLFPLSIFLVVGRVHLIARIIFIGLMIYIAAYAMDQVQYKYRISDSQGYIEQLSKINQETAHGKSSGGGSSQEHRTFSTLTELLLFLPFGFFTALFRPLPGDVFSSFGFLASFEGVLFLWLFLRAWKRSSLRDLKNPLIFWGVLVVLSWTSVYAFVAYQNLGTAMRWRLQILPLFLGLMLYLGRDRTKTMSTPVTEHDIPPSQIK